MRAGGTVHHVSHPHLMYGRWRGDKHADDRRGYLAPGTMLVLGVTGAIAGVVGAVFTVISRGTSRVDHETSDR